MYKDKSFRLRDVNEVIEDLVWARRKYRRVERIFLADGDALCLKNSKLMVILDHIRENFPECERVTVYGRAHDALRKTREELIELKEAGITMVYMGAESGSDEVLKQINKGETREELIRGVRHLEDAGIKTSVTFINGIAGKENWEKHAVETGTMITEMNASYVSLLTLMLDPDVPIYRQIKRGELTLLSPEEVVAETYLMLEHAKPEKSCVFRSNHASNYLSLKGNLPEDREEMMAQLERAMEHTGMLKDERFRML